MPPSTLALTQPNYYTCLSGKLNPFFLLLLHTHHSHTQLFMRQMFSTTFSPVCLSLCLSTCWTVRHLCLLLLLIRSVADGTFPQTTKTALLTASQVPDFLGGNSSCRTFAEKVSAKSLKSVKKIPASYEVYQYRKGIVMNWLLPLGTNMLNAAEEKLIDLLKETILLYNSITWMSSQRPKCKGSVNSW